MRQLSRVDTRREHGFTLAELVVAMIITMIVLGLVSRVLVDGLTAKESSAGTASATVTANQAAETLANDIRMARNVNRDTADDAALVAGTMNGVDVRDILLAQPYNLQLRGDGDPNSAGMECIHYQVDEQGSLWRALKTDWATCGVISGRLIDATRILPGLGAKDAESTPDISAELGFSLLYSAGANRPPSSTTFAYSIAVPDENGRCDRRTVTSVPTAQLHQILAITMTLRPLVMGRTGFSEAGISSSVTMRARANRSYVRAIGCSAGIR